MGRKSTERPTQDLLRGRCKRKERWLLSSFWPECTYWWCSIKHFEFYTWFVKLIWRATDISIFHLGRKLIINFVMFAWLVYIKKHVFFYWNTPQNLTAEVRDLGLALWTVQYAIYWPGVVQLSDRHQYQSNKTSVFHQVRCRVFPLFDNLEHYNLILTDYLDATTVPYCHCMNFY